MSNWYDNIVSSIVNALEAVFVKKSSTNGLIKNNGMIDTNTYLTTGSASSTYQAKESGKGLSTNDFTTAYKSKLDDLPTKHITNIYIDNEGYLCVTWNGEQED